MRQPRAAVRPSRAREPSAVRIVIESMRWRVGLTIPLLVPLDRIAADVRLPDGRTLAEAGVSYSAVAIARLIHPGDRERPENVWRDVPVKVKVKVRGEKRRVTIEWRAGPPGGSAVVTTVDAQ